MKKILIKVIPKVLTKKILVYKHRYRLLTESGYYLHDAGYLKSFLEKKLLDNEENFLSWMNYSVIHFLERKLNKIFEIFEYNSGSSTIFCVQQVKKVTPIEKDDGIIILDDNSRDRSQPAFHFLEGIGFKELTFSGIKPSGHKNDFITIFYRTHNCFNI